MKPGQLIANGAGERIRILAIGPSRPALAAACPLVPWWIYDDSPKIIERFGAPCWFEGARRVCPGFVRWEMPDNADERDRFIAPRFALDLWRASERSIRTFTPAAQLPGLIFRGAE